MYNKSIYNPRTTDTGYNRKIYGKRPLPAYDLPRPPGPFSDSRCCLIFSLFIAWDGIIPYYHINSAFWAAHSWRVNTNSIEREWDLWFLVEKELYQIPEVRQMFEKANLTDFVLLFEPVKGSAIRRKNGIALYATVLPYFENYYRAYLLDCDMFVGLSDEKYLLDVDRLLETGEDETLLKSFECYYVEKPYLRPALRLYDLKYPEKAEQLLKGFIENYLGASYDSHFSIMGVCYAWNPQQLDPDFKEMVMELTPNVPNDEIQVGLYYLKKDLRENPPKSLSKIWDIGILLNREGFFEGKSHYFDHVELDPATDDFDDPEIREIWRANAGLNKRL